MKIFEFGKVVKGLKIDGKPANYPVLNERDTRAGAGIMLFLGVLAFSFAFFQKNYFLINGIVILFFLEFLVRLINPSLAPFYATGAFIVRKMRPEYTGAVQKRFAWGLGLAMAGTMIILIYGFQIRGMINLGFCIICLSLMWLESSFGICLGCKLYYLFMNFGLIKKPEEAPACPGGVCPISKNK